MSRLLQEKESPALRTLGSINRRKAERKVRNRGGSVPRERNIMKSPLEPTQVQNAPILILTELLKIEHLNKRQAGVPFNVGTNWTQLSFLSFGKI